MFNTNKLLSESKIIKTTINNNTYYITNLMLEGFGNIFDEQVISSTNNNQSKYSHFNIKNNYLQNHLQIQEKALVAQTLSRLLSFKDHIL